MKIVKRLISIGIAVSQIAAYAAVTPVTSQAATIYAVNDTFETGNVGEWYLRNTVNNPVLSVQTESGNSFLRLSVTKMNKDTNTNGNDENPCVTRDIATGTTSLESGCTVIETKFRTNSAYFRKYFKFNYPKTTGNAGLVDTTTYYDNGYGDINQNYYTLMHLHQGGNAYVYRRKNTQTNTIRTITMPDNSTVTLNQPEFNSMTTYNTNTWYKVKFVINNETDNVSTYLYNESGTLLASYTSGVKDIWYFDEETELKTLDFFYRATSNTALEASTADTLDIDDVKVYQVTDTAKAELDGGNLQIKQNSFKIKFDSPMKPDTVTDTNIELYKGTDFITTTGVYDATNNIYTMTPQNPLTTGSYKIVFKPDVAGAANDYFTTVAFGTTEIDFEYYQSTPPVATNVTIAGNVIHMGTLNFITYTYNQEDNTDPGTPEIQWQYSTDNVQWNDISGATSTSYQLEDESVADCYIRAAVVPKTIDGVRGQTAYSNVLIPEKAPTASNVSIAGDLYTGSTLTATYDYFDANNDSQGESKIVWLSASSANASNEEFTQLAEGTTYRITDEDIGKYIKVYVIPVSQREPNKTDKYYSSVVGPIRSARDATNMLVNGGFETGDKTGWVDEFKLGASMEVVSAEKYNGSYSLFIKDRTYSTDNWHQKVTLQSGRTYLVDGYARLADNSAVEETIMEGYFGRGKVDRMYRDDEKVTVGKSWTRVSLTAAATEDSTGEIQIVCWPPDGTAGYDYYVDDVYCGELTVSDIEFTAPSSIEIPVSGETHESLRTTNIVNQIGTTAGLYNETVTFELPDNPQGVYINGSELFVTSSAVAGKITLDAVCTPTYPSAQTEYRKSVEIELLANNSTAPKVSNAVLTGTTELNNVINLTYDYYQVEGKTDASQVKWYVSDSYDGAYTEIVGASGRSYTVDSTNAGKYVYAEVTAMADGGESGNTDRSNIVAPSTAPEARDVKITGERFVDSVLTGSFTFYDINNDLPGTSTFRWLRSDNPTTGFVPVDGATQSTYTLTAADVDKYIVFEVTPVSSVEPVSGQFALSAAVKGPTKPVATDVEIKRTGNRLIGSYKYTHEANVVEGTSTFRWIHNNNVIGNGSYIDIDSTYNGTITFEVTPVAVKEPYSGDKKTASITVTSSDGSAGSGGGGGGGGGSYNPSAVVDAPKVEEEQKTENVTEVATPTQTGTDISGHWSESSVRNAVSKGIMNLTEQGNFFPDLLVTRADVAVYLAKALGENTKGYNESFTDVSKEDWFAGYLQVLVDKGIFARDEKFNPYKPITREEICRLLVVIKESKDGEITAKDLSVFTDSAEISDWAIDAIAKAYAAGIISGSDDGRIIPKGNVTRAQMAVLIEKLNR